MNGATEYEKYDEKKKFLKLNLKIFLDVFRKKS